MKGWVRSTLVLLLILLVTTVFFALIYRPPDREAVPETPQVYFEVQITPSGLDPETIQVTEGSLVSLNVTSMGGDHHFSLPTFGISRGVRGGETITVRFQVRLPGTFPYQCLITAPDHLDEQGTLRVIPSA